MKIAVEADAADAYLQVRAYQARLAVAHRQETVRQDLVVAAETAGWARASRPNGSCTKRRRNWKPFTGRHPAAHRRP